ncbi:unnamed protein product, partial [Hapterophycus canaliculatus]
QDVTPEDIFDAVGGVISRCEGGYAVVAMINGIGIVGFRDPNGIRPLVFGTREKSKVEGATKDYVVSSESVVMDMLGFELTREFSQS